MIVISKYTELSPIIRKTKIGADTLESSVCNMKIKAFPLACFSLLMLSCSVFAMAGATVSSLLSVAIYLMMAPHAKG